MDSPIKLAVMNVNGSGHKVSDGKLLEWEEATFNAQELNKLSISFGKDDVPGMWIDVIICKHRESLMQTLFQVVLFVNLQYIAYGNDNR